MKILQTAERVSHEDMSDNYVFQRSLLAYLEAARIVSGDVLEIGAGEGYGIKHIAPKANKYLTLDKHPVHIDPEYTNVSFKQMNIPPLVGIEDNSFDFVVSFQVIEHIEADDKYVSEIHRVLRPGGKFILTTPNKKMSITRNPWHVREYTIEELIQLLGQSFSKVDAKGVFGNEKIMEYYNKNKASVRKITRFDIFDLQHKLPRQILQIPYDILNRMNRKKLLNQNNNLVSDIHYEDYSISEAKEGCFDLFYVATK
ncbi:MAG: SAM-dependent methyltransferase [Saprospiraceae bacterium]|jgi:SAM-dependent methyltransferase